MLPPARPTFSDRRVALNFVHTIQALAAALDAAHAQNAASAAIVRVLTVKAALQADDWRTFMADLKASAEIDLAGMPISVDGDDRQDVIRHAALDCLAASVGDLERRFLAVERSSEPRPGGWDWPDLSDGAP